MFEQPEEDMYRENIFYYRFEGKKIICRDANYSYTRDILTKTIIDSRRCLISYVGTKQNGTDIEKMATYRRYNNIYSQQNISTCTYDRVIHTENRSFRKYNPILINNNIYIYISFINIQKTNRRSKISNYLFTKNDRI